jgi:hypothetical protein
MVKQGDAKTANSYASAARNLATVAGISNDKAAAAHGRPTEISERPGPETVRVALEGLRRLGVLDPEPVVDAQVVADD